MARDRSFNPFTCPNCQALYQVVKVEAGPETVDCEVACRSCGALSARRVAANIAKLPDLLSKK